jgi:Ca2+-binding EF-hand superfamily protein
MSSNVNNKTFQYKTEIKEAFKSLDPDNNGIIETNQLNNINKLMNLNKKNPFIYNTINSLISKKNEENDEYLSSKEYISFFDEQLNDIKSKEGKEKIFEVFKDNNKESFSWTKLAMTAKELGDNDTANKLLKLIEQSKLYNKEINFEEFSDLLNDDYENNIKSSNESEDLEEKENSKIKNKKDEEEMKTISSKNEEPKENEGEKTNKRYHRRYRDTKNKTENNDNVNNNNNNNKVYTKYRKKK